MADKRPTRPNDSGKGPGDPAAIRGRGTALNPPNRFADQVIVSERPTPGSVATEVREENCRTILSRNRSPDIPFEYSLNPYRGCEHGCIYCYARPTHAYWDLSPGIDFETRIISKPGAAALLEKTFRRRGYQCQEIAIGANTDPYQPLEASLGITRDVLSVCQRYQHPVSLITKGELVLRDLDILAAMAADNLCSVAVSVTTLNDDLKRVLEPRAASGSARLRAIRALSDAGVPVTMLVAPVIPFINDDELETIVHAGREAGARAARYIMIRLPLETADLFHDWLATHYPSRASRVINAIRSTRNGRDYESGFGKRMTGEGVLARSIAKRFDIATRKAGYPTTQQTLDRQRFRFPDDTQMGLFD